MEQASYQLLPILLQAYRHTKAPFLHRKPTTHLRLIPQIKPHSRSLGGNRTREMKPSTGKDKGKKASHLSKNASQSPIGSWRNGSKSGSLLCSLEVPSFLNERFFGFVWVQSCDGSKSVSKDLKVLQRASPHSYALTPMQRMFLSLFERSYFYRARPIERCRLVCRERRSSSTRVGGFPHAF
mgnify:FL=1